MGYAVKRILWETVKISAGTPYGGLKRFNQVAEPCHLAAYLLHPKYQGELLSVTQTEEAKKWITKKNPDFLSTVIAFEAQCAPLPASYFLPGATDNLSPLNWWKAVGKRAGLSDAFMRLMRQLHSAVASSSSIERVFSSFGLIHTKLRNRLGNEKAAKLVFCHRLLRGPKPIDYEWTVQWYKSDFKWFHDS